MGTEVTAAKAAREESDKRAKKLEAEKEELEAAKEKVEKRLKSS